MNTAGFDTYHDEGAVPCAGFPDFDSLVAPLGSTMFFQRYWEQRAFHIRRDCPGYFDALLSLRDMDACLGTTTFHEPDLRVVKQGKDRPFKEYAKDGVADRAALLQAFASGWLLLFCHLGRHHAPLGEAIARCEAQLHLPLRANVYLSPPDSQGFKLHWDTHDVLVLQIDGEKTWHIYDNPIELPHEEQLKLLPALAPNANKLAEVTLRPGDVLFLPRGYVHAATAGSTHSLHITVGLRSLTVGDVALRECRRRSLGHAPLARMALHRDYQDPARLHAVRQLIHEVIDQLDMDAALDEVYCSFIRSRQPAASGRLLALTRPGTLDHDSALRLRSGALFEMFEQADAVTLAVDGRVLTLPAGVAPAIRFIEQAARFCAGQLPGLEYESRLLLTQTLHAQGLVEEVAD